MKPLPAAGTKLPSWPSGCRASASTPKVALSRTWRVGKAAPKPARPRPTMPTTNWRTPAPHPGCRWAPGGEPLMVVPPARDQWLVSRPPSSQVRRPFSHSGQRQQAPNRWNEAERLPRRSAHLDADPTQGQRDRRLRMMSASPPRNVGSDRSQNTRRFTTAMSAMIASNHESAPKSPSRQVRHSTSP